MSGIALVASVLLAAHVISCTLVTRRVVGSNFYEPVQKKIQIAIVWLVPVLGVVLVWMFLCHERPGREIEPESEDDDIEESIFTSHDSPPTTEAVGGETSD